MFCDWSFGYAIECQRGRSPDEYEKRSIEREHNLVALADEVFVLFPLAEKYLKNSRPTARTHYLGNVINAVVEPSVGDLAVKLTKQSLLFIGKPHYIAGANRLISAYNNLKPTHPHLTLEIVGMDATFFDNLPEGVRCHGYLDKGRQSDCDKYYELLRQARLYVNTTPGWASFSATLEALYFYTPIITSRYPEIVETLGEELNCGSYCDVQTYALEELIELYLAEDSFTLPAISANEIASQFKWENYIDKFLEIIENTNKVRASEK
jgi:glycosyltransferase involved in cell wall biosynthesis